mgnify:CR=1 FL=1
MVILGIFNVDDFSFLDGLLVAFMAIVMVFAILLLVIAITSGFSKTISVVDAKNNILDRPKDANVGSVTLIDE